MGYVNIRFHGSSKQYAYSYDVIEKLPKGTSVSMRTPYSESNGLIVSYVDKVSFSGTVKAFAGNCLNFSELFPKKPKPKADTSHWNDFDF